VAQQGKLSLEFWEIPDYIVVLRLPRKTWQDNFQYCTQANKTFERNLTKRVKGLHKLPGQALRSHSKTKLSKIGERYFVAHEAAVLHQ